jgi:GTP-binding protein
VSPSLPYQQASYTISAPRLELCPTDSEAEVAFIGRSNAGKSSAINALTSQNKLARTSKTPGRTQLLNYFTLAPGRYLVDVPGFGYAKVSADMQRQWQHQLERYLQKREVLSGLVLLMDIRHPFMDSDNMMINWCSQSAIPLHILLTKADKLAFGPAKTALLQVRKQLSEKSELATVQLFSALKNQGVDELRAKLDSWLAPSAEQQAGEESV